MFNHHQFLNPHIHHFVPFSVQKKTKTKTRHNTLYFSKTIFIKPHTKTFSPLKPPNTPQKPTITKQPPSPPQYHPCLRSVKLTRDATTARPPTPSRRPTGADEPYSDPDRNAFLNQIKAYRD